MSALRYYRNRCGLTQEQLAELAGTSQPQIRRLESYQRSLTKEWADVLAGPLGVSPDDLLFPPEIALSDAPDIRDLLREINQPILNISEATGISRRILEQIRSGRPFMKDDIIIALAKYLDLEVSYVRQAMGATADRMRSSNRSSKVDAVIGVSLQGAQVSLSHSSSSMQVLGEVAAGRWIATDDNIDEPKFSSVPLAADPQWPASAQYGLVVRGTSIDKFASDGDVLHCVSVEEAGVLPINGEMVIVEQERDGGLLRELTAKVYHRNDNGSIELRAFSNDPRWDHHIHLPSGELTQSLDNGVTINVKAVVVGSYRPAKIGRARSRR